MTTPATTPATSPTIPAASPLPYRDTKPVGAADFYFAINATFRFILQRFGMDGLRRYWTDLGRTYMAPVAQAWTAQGLDGVAAYQEAFFQAEPGAVVSVTRAADCVVLEVQTCPAIAHLRQHGREIVPCFCQHCYYVGEAMAEPAGLTLRIEGGNGACRQTFSRRDRTPQAQDIRRIEEAR
jgi:hypothetical protein